jgi:hypothetical protein
VTLDLSRAMGGYEAARLLDHANINADKNPLPPTVTGCSS